MRPRFVACHPDSDASAQIFIAGYMPSQAFAATAALAVAAAAVTCLKVSGALEGGAAGAWRTYRDVQGLLGVATLPQVLPVRHLDLDKQLQNPRA